MLPSADTGPVVRAATEADLPAITALYADEVRDRVATYEYEVPTLEDMRSRWQRLEDHGFPYLVAETGGRFAGYAYAGPYRGRIGYQWTVENAIYIDPAQQGRGVGRALLQALIDACEAQGFRQMVAVIGDGSNAASVALHERLGFTTVGVYRGLGRKQGRWLDTVQMQRALGAGDTSAPAGPAVPRWPG
ncbi:GNAT family N-acetyltransferase [Marilutibacter aestuarii]|uniref:N-acetyltransferase n=1 Tax=Marilutibacter aestuarii TaxID=1706195 RepID=A0A508AL46_9GAMM|nr:GNAT family N-acetyltransferase [Lysobacter aestuarii]TQD46392.1 N-acetyltransferase [Lysobacter aestuarii]